MFSFSYANKWKIGFVFIQTVFVFGVTLFLYGSWKYPVMEFVPVFLRSLFIGLLLNIGYLLGFRFFLKRKNYSKEKFGVAAIAGFVGFVLLVHGLFLTVNGVYDVKDFTTYQLRVITKYRTTSGYRSGSKSFIVVKSWKPNRETESLKLGKGWASIVPGLTVCEVKIKPGALGFKRLLSMRIEESSLFQQGDIFYQEIFPASALVNSTQWMTYSYEGFDERGLKIKYEYHENVELRQRETIFLPLDTQKRAILSLKKTSLPPYHPTVHKLLLRLESKEKNPPYLQVGLLEWGKLN